MYTLLLHNENDDCLILELDDELASNCILVDEEYADEASSKNEAFNEEMFHENEQLELSFIHKLEPFEEVYELKTINTLAALSKLNELAYKYERCSLVKLATSSPFDLRCFALCSKKREPVLELSSNQYIVNNINRIKGFIRLLLAYASNCSRHHSRYIKRRELYILGMKSA